MEWCNQKENMKHSYDIGLRDREKLREKMRKIAKNQIGKKGHHIRKVAQINKNNNQIIKIWDSQTDASKELNMCVTSIQNVCAGRNKTAGGYKWKYVDNP